MSFFDLFFSNDIQKKQKARNREMANLNEIGYDEIEETKCDSEALAREKFYNYEYSNEEE